MEEENASTTILLHSVNRQIVSSIQDGTGGLIAREVRRASVRDENLVDGAATRLAEVAALAKT